MKKMKKMLALALAFVLAVTILPMVGREQAKAASIPGYYRWYMDRSGNSQFVTEGTPVVSGLTGFVATSGKATLWASDYTNAIVEGKVKYISVTSHGATNKYERSCRLDSDNFVTFTAPCDGTIEMCYKPGGKNTQKSTYLTVNNEQVGETITLDDKESNYSYLAADKKWVYEMSVEEGESYKIAAPNYIALSQIIFEPSPVSARGASYRNETDEYTNGIRFGSTIDKTKIDYNSKETESGTLIARKTTMDSYGVTELTMASVGTVCLKVVRTTYLEETDDVLNYAAAIVNIPAGKLDDKFVARSYVVIDGVTYYGAQMIDTWNSVKTKADAKADAKVE